MFGPVKFRLARTREQIDRDISMGRVGRELFPPLILIVALVLGLEMLVANRFYKSRVISVSRMRLSVHQSLIPNPDPAHVPPLPLSRLRQLPAGGRRCAVAGGIDVVRAEPGEDRATASGDARPAARGGDRAGDAGHAPADADLHANEEAGGHAGRAGRPVAEHVGARRRGQQDPLGGPARRAGRRRAGAGQAANAISS